MKERHQALVVEDHVETVKTSSRFWSRSTAGALSLTMPKMRKNGLRRDRFVSFFWTWKLRARRTQLEVTSSMERKYFARFGKRTAITTVDSCTRYLCSSSAVLHVKRMSLLK